MGDPWYVAGAPGGEWYWISIYELILNQSGVRSGSHRAARGRAGARHGTHRRRLTRRGSRVRRISPGRSGLRSGCLPRSMLKSTPKVRRPRNPGGRCAVREEPGGPPFAYFEGRARSTGEVSRISPSRTTSRTRRSKSSRRLLWFVLHTRRAYLPSRTVYDGAARPPS